MKDVHKDNALRSNIKQSQDSISFLLANCTLRSDIFSTTMENAIRSSFRKSSPVPNSLQSLSFLMNNVLGASTTQRTLDLFNNVILASVGLFSGLHCLNEVINIVKNPSKTDTNASEDSKRRKKQVPKLLQLSDGVVDDAYRTGESSSQESTDSNRSRKRRFVDLNSAASSTDEDEAEVHVVIRRNDDSESMETARHSKQMRKLEEKNSRHKKTKSPLDEPMKKRSNETDFAMSNVGDDL